MTKKTKKKTPKKESKKKPNIYDGCEIEDFIQKLVDSKPENPSKNKDLTPSGDDKEDYCESESCNTPNLPIFKCPQFEKIACTLVAAHWEIDARAIERNILLISRESQKCILHLFYGDKKANAWLTDEEEFNGESPLWFSESSHVISPIYTVTKYHKELDATEFEFSQSIVILMHPHYTLNADEKIDEWGDTLVVSLERFCALIEQEEQLDFVTTKIDDVGKEPHRDKKYQNNKEINIIGYLKFDDNLQSWQKTDKNKTKGEGRHTEELTCNNNIDTVMDDFNEIEIKRIRFGMECPDNDYCEHNSSLLTHFISGKKGILTLDIEISGIPDTSRLYLLELLDERGKRVANDYSYFHPSVRRTIDITLPPLEAGYYTFSLKSASKELYNQRLKFVDLEYGYKKYINLEGFALYRIEDEDNEIDHMHIMERGAMSCYNHDGLAGLLSVVIIKNISTREIPYQAILIIKNEVGEVIYEDQNHGELDIDEIYVFTSEVMDVVCKRGNYTVILKFMGEVILVGDFVVGKRDIKGAFKLDQLFSRSGRNSVIVNSPSDSMKEIDQMIGLKSLKKQLHKSIAKIKLDRLREKEGLPIKPQQLHMAFLGNPGTGKTTVAKLLGQVYKSIGLLSKGHVVLEDRTTLMTQNWGGEGEMVNKALDKAQGGILFIDEAYDLVTEHKTDPGKLIISALLQAMSDESSRNIMIIFAGYTLPM
ncbi:MAG: AAA family ATPase, partial [Rikenellaceae bacterium]